MKSATSTKQTKNEGLNVSSAMKDLFRITMPNLFNFLFVGFALSLPAICWLVYCATQYKIGNFSFQNFETFGMVVFAILVVPFYALASASITLGANNFGIDSAPSLPNQVLDGLKEPFRLIGLTTMTGIAILVGLIFFVIPGVMLLCAFSLVIPVMVLEKRGVEDSIKRSASLTKGHRLTIFGLILLVTVPGMLLQTILDELLKKNIIEIWSFTSLHIGINLVSLVFSSVMAVVVFNKLKKLETQMHLPEEVAVFE